MDGDIYYCDIFFLTWISKHEKEGFHATLGSFLFMGVCQTPMEELFMDPCISLLPVHGENFFFAFIDCLTQYLHTLTIYMQCIAPQEGKLFIELHGQHWAKLYDGDNHILYGLGKVFYYFMYAHLMYPAICYLSVDVMTYIIIHVSKNNLP